MMPRIAAIATLGGLLFGLCGRVALAAPPPPPPVSQRGVKICVAATASAEVRQAAERVLAAVPTHPLLALLAGAHTPAGLTDSTTLLAEQPGARAYDHLVLIGLPDDPLIVAAWQREARQIPGGLYIFGFGHLTGEIGYIESDRNPFLHGAAIPKAPYETEVITLTGSTPAGVVLAVDAFLTQGLLSGVVAQPGWQRPTPNLLQRDPLPPTFQAPAQLPPRLGEWTRIGVTQASEDEYRGVLADSGVLPQEIWRVKYYQDGVWDSAGAEAAVEAYAAGLHRRAYANTVWCARFASPEEATRVVPKIVGSAGLRRDGQRWSGQQPPYGYGNSPGTLILWQKGACVYMSTLPAADTAVLQQEVQ